MRLLRLIQSAAVCIGLSLGLCATAAAFTVIEGEYKLPASFDPKVTTSLKTELWARVYRPATEGTYPLVVFLHGNHATCGRFDAGLGVRVDDRVDYTTTGTCPAGYVVAPSHLGYSYLARSLAAKGYVVVSINANRGVNAAPGVSGDSGLNLRRGRLVLRHLEELSKWNAGATPPASLGFTMAGLLDYSHIGLMGHSRGGEGMRAALDQYKEAGSPWPTRIGPATFEGLFEIGPVDGQTSRVLNAVGLAWNVLLPGCDGDVSDLQGVKPFDRMLAIKTEATSLRKSTFEVYGANHNFYNTEWQLSDAYGCTGQTPIFPQTLGSPQQRRTASGTLIPFMQASVGPTKLAGQANRFDPSYPLSASLTSITSYARGFTGTPRSSQNFIIDNFNKATGTSSASVANQSSGLSHYSHGSAGFSHDSTQRAATVGWSTSSGTKFLQTNASAAGVPLNVSSYLTLEFRVALQCTGSLCSSSSDPTGDVDFSIALANSDGTLSTPITLKSVAVVRRPVGSFSTNVVFQTVRVPLTAFTGAAGADLTQFRGVRFTFDQTSSRTVQFGNVRLTKKKTGPGGLSASAPLESAGGADSAAQAKAAASDVNRIIAVRRLATSGQIEVAGPAVEIEVASSRGFPVGGALPEIRIGSDRFTLSRFADGSTDRLIFTLTVDEFNALVNGANVTVGVGGAAAWSFGALSK
jgi:hypothetical protein